MRLFHQQVLEPKFTQPAQVVAHLGAMQAQEYAMAKWAVGLRMASATNSILEEAFQSGQILRTHLLRPTWHFVVPEDIHWLLKLTSPHVHRRNAPLYKKHELTPDVLSSACAILEKTLMGGARLTREELSLALTHAGIPASGQRLAYVLMHAELEGVLCSGGRKGKQFTYALLSDIIRPPAGFHREEAIACLAERYFASRGPATARDFATWSGLSMKDTRLGTSLLDKRFSKAPLNGEDAFFLEPAILPPLGDRATFLLPDYDEYGMGYQNRDVLSPRKAPAEPPSLYSHWLVVNGRMEGTWEFSGAKRADASALPYFPFEGEESLQVRNALERYQSFWV